LAILLLPAFAGAADIDAASGLKKNPGWEQVRAHCGGCHSHALVTGQRADRNTWLDIIRWMQATQNLWQFQPEVETQILDYLAANYPPQPNRRRAPIPPSLMPKAVQVVQ
jgi:hypothetical protein